MRRFLLVGAAVVVMWTTAGVAQNLPWNNPGGQTAVPATSAPAPKRDIGGIWDARGGGIWAPGKQTPPPTPPRGAPRQTHHPGGGARVVSPGPVKHPPSTRAGPPRGSRTL